MKFLKYKFVAAEINHGTEEEPKIEQILIEKSMSYSAEAEEIAKKEAYNGEYTIEDDGAEEVPAPTQQDKWEAQLMYTAMMTDTLLLEET